MEGAGDTSCGEGAGFGFDAWMFFGGGRHCFVLILLLFCVELLSER